MKGAINIDTEDFARLIIRELKKQKAAVDPAAEKEGNYESEKESKSPHALYNNGLGRSEN